MQESRLFRLRRLADLIRGYFQGIARIEETAWSQIIEQFFRILLITWMLPFILSPDNTAMNAAYAMFITMLAELSSVTLFTIQISTT